MNRGRSQRWYRRAVPLAAAALCLGLTGVPVSAPSPAMPVSDAVLATATLGHVPTVRPVATGQGTPYSAIVAGLVDIDSRIPGGTSSGTGIVLRRDGVVVTNNHVVARATDIVATDLGDGRRYPVIVLDRDPGHDVAVIQLVGAAHLAVAPIGDSDRIEVGDRVAAIGNAGGLGGRPTITTGAVTALDRSIVASDESSHQRRHLHGMIQVSATVRPGDSGGALAGAGGVIGMITATSPGAGFAIPIDTVRSIADDVSLRPSSSRSE